MIRKTIIRAVLLSVNLMIVSLFSVIGVYADTESVTADTETQSIELRPSVYEGGKNGKYDESVKTSSTTSFGNVSLTSLKIGQSNGSDIKTVTKNGFDAYGITGDNVGLYMSLNDISDKEWSIIQDEYGGRKKETVNGVHVGDVSSGALLIQKSSDGKTWEQLDRGRYSEGLYTTDYCKNYADQGDVLIYTPDGGEVLNGVYIKVSFAYEVSKKSKKTKNRILEVYEFYMCGNDLDAVTFHNLSVSSETIEKIGSDNEIESEIIKTAETLLSGSGTISGFTIDTSGCPLAEYTVLRNDKQYDVSPGEKITTDGKYEIKLKSDLGDTKTVILFVERLSPEYVYKKYFGNGFISGKRVYSYDSEVPVFEAGQQTEYKIEDREQNSLPINGKITNHSANVVRTISSGQKGVLNEPGYYTAEFTTRPEHTDSSFPGDYHTYRFSFSIIEEGTAPGPVLNKQLLADYSKKNVSDSYPKYYGLTYQSAGKGTITRAFSTREEAFAYAYNYEKGTVESHDDEPFMYAPVFGNTAQTKQPYNTQQQLTDKVNESADAAVQELYFDMTSKASYCTLDENISMDNDNLRKLELNNSVIIFSEGQKEKMCENELLPIISPKPYYIVDKYGKERQGLADFEFSRDKYGCDSDSVTITDINGKEYDIEYQKGVGMQLQEMGCPSGKVRITERTKYNDETTYDAVFIAKDDNTAELSISYYNGDNIKTATFDKADKGTTIETDAFRIDKLTDDLDPYSIVRVTNNDTSQRKYAVADDLGDMAFTSAGSYEIAVINRIGYFYTINAVIKESKYLKIAFDGDGTEDIKCILTKTGSENVLLSTLSRDNSELEYFLDENGEKYSGSIDKIMFEGDTLLKAVWKDKKCRLKLLAPDGNVIKTELLDIGCKYVLPSPKIKEGTEYIGVSWLRDGIPVEGGVINIDSDEDISLTASFPGIENTNLVNIGAEDNGISLGYAAAAGVTVVSLVAVLMIVRRCVGKSGKKKEEGRRS